jgi:hypothetical protein
VSLLLLGLLGANSFAFSDLPPLPGVKIFAIDSQASEEGPDEGIFIVMRTGSTAESLTVFYTVDGTAEEGVDYQALPGYVTIPSGFASATVVVNPTDDLEIEDKETVVLTVIDPPGGATYVPCWPTRARVAIEDNDTEANSPPEVKIVNPRDGAVFVGPDSITLVAKASDRDGFVKTVEFFDGDTSLGVVTYPRPLSSDEITANPELLEDVISRKMSELEVERLDTIENLKSEGLAEHFVDPSIQIFRLKWENIAPGEHVLTALATDRQGESTLSEPIAIKVEEGSPIPVVNVIAIDPIATEEGGIIVSDIEENAFSDGSVEEGRPDVLRPNNAVFLIKRRATDISRPLDVFYRVLGTAINGADYRRIPHHVTIPADAYAVRVIIRAIDDELLERTESVVIKLVSHTCDEILTDVPGCYQVGPHGIARAAIIDNDTPTTNLPPSVHLVQPRDGDLFKAGADLSLVANASDRDGYIKFVEFFEGENSLGIIENPLIPYADGSVEPLSASTKLEIQQLPLYRIVWEDVPAGRYVLTAVATDNRGEQTTSIPVEIGVIESYPVPVVTIITADPVAEEQAAATDVVSNTAHFVVARRGGNIERPLTVSYRVGGRAENGVDYRALSGFATIKAGEYKERIVIAPIDDEECEGTESVIIKLVPPILPQNDINIAAFLPYRVGDPDKARAVIEDNDICPDNQPPRVVIIFPFDGMVFQAPVDVPLFALAGDVDGEVAEVSFYANATLIGEAVRVGPDVGWALYRADWQDAPAGEYKLTAVAVDDDGATTRSRTVGIEVLAEGDPGVGRVVDVVRHRFRNNFPDAVPVDGERDDWHYSKWLGYLTSKAFPWVYHDKHRWMYILETGRNGHSMFDLNGLEWVWTSESIYPYLYSFKNKEWLYYDIKSKSPRWFYSESAGWHAID